MFYGKNWYKLLTDLTIYILLNMISELYNISNKLNYKHEDLK